MTRKQKTSMDAFLEQQSQHPLESYMANQK